MLGHTKKGLLQAQQPERAAPEAAADGSRAASGASDSHASPDWRQVRRAARPQDLYPSTLAMAWLADLPRAAVPRLLAHDYPRIANRLALCWRDPALAILVLDSLLVDRRGGRQGFPDAIAQELRRLRAEAQKRAMPDEANRADTPLGRLATGLPPSAPSDGIDPQMA